MNPKDLATQIKKLFFFISSILFVSCAGGPSKEEISDNLFDALFGVTRDFEKDIWLQFEGGSQVGSVSGEANIFLKQGRKDSDRILTCTYSALNNVAREDFVITGLEKKNLNTDKWFENDQSFARNYIKGKFKSKDSGSQGDIVFAIDSLNNSLFVRLYATGNHYYFGNINLTKDNHIKIKKVFVDSISPSEEEKILEIYNKPRIELIADNLIDIGDNKYKFQISKSELIKNEFYRSNGDSWWSETSNLLSFKIKNITNDTLDIELSSPFKNFDPDGCCEYSTDSPIVYELNLLRGFFGDSYQEESFRGFKPNESVIFEYENNNQISGKSSKLLNVNGEGFTYEVSSNRGIGNRDDMREFRNNYIFQDEDGNWSYNDKIKISELLNDSIFINFLEDTTSKFPIIEFKDITNFQNEQILPTKVYLEFID